jgi:hypothetical protein
MKKIILIIFLLNSVKLIAQEKYITMKAVSWDELQLNQLDSLLSSEELNLSARCPSSLTKLVSSYEKSSTQIQHILGTNYIWTEFINNSGKKCLVKQNKIDSISPEDNSEIDPNSYQILDNTQSRVLISASKGVNFKEKGYFENVRIANQYNENIAKKEYMKYGGINNLVSFMQKNKAVKKLDKNLIRGRIRHENGAVIKKTIPIHTIFENTYSQEQIQQLIEEVKAKKKQVTTQNLKLH